MEIHDPNLHLKLIEMCDCYLETDFKSQIQKTAKVSSGNLEEDSCKYLALTIMYALTEKAQKLTYKNKKGQLTVAIKADGDKTSVKAPSAEVFNKIISIIRTILHLEDDNASMPLALGLRSGQVEIQVKVERGEDNREALRFKFPDLGH
jgi:ribosomal protein L23